MKSTLVAAAATALVATVTGQCTSYMEIQGAINAVQTACPSPSAPLAGQAISLPSTCSATCASAFNSWYMGGQGACFTALNLPPTMISTFQNFGGLCGGGGAVCPQTACPGAAEDRYVLVDQAMSWAQAQSYCRSRYRDLASIHSADEEELARAKCGTSATMNHCVDRFVDSASCTGTAGCWIGLHQAIGQSYSTDEVVVFDNAAQCHVDHRIPENLLDVPLDTSKFSSPLYPILYFGHLTTSLPLGPPPDGVGGRGAALTLCTIASRQSCIRQSIERPSRVRSTAEGGPLRLQSASPLSTAPPRRGTSSTRPRCATCCSGAVPHNVDYPPKRWP